MSLNFKNLFIHPLFFYIVVGIIIFCTAGFFIPVLFLVAKYLLFFLMLFSIADFLLLFIPQKAIVAFRYLPEKLSNGDENTIDLVIKNNYPFLVRTEIIDELPAQLQNRDFSIFSHIEAKSNRRLDYKIIPGQRGVYIFGSLHVYCRSPLGLIIRRFSFDQNKTVAVYPSFVQLRKYDLLNFTNSLRSFGFKKIRRLGHTMEFEKIKEYIGGDDIRTINWKATAKSRKLMVNQYQDEKSQSVYCIIEKGRSMKMPFGGLSLLDHAINATLVLSSVILRKQDKVGMLTFSRKIENPVFASTRSGQMQRILESLYHINTDFKESDFGRLYTYIRNKITQRSLIFLFTNFETLDSLKRQFHFIKSIARHHLLVVIFFENTELNEMTKIEAKTEQEIIDKVIAEKFAYEKKLIVRELKKFGIMSILTRPEDLTIDTINKYLELKARGQI